METTHGLQLATDLGDIARKLNGVWFASIDDALEALRKYYPTADEGNRDGVIMADGIVEPIATFGWMA